MHEKEKISEETFMWFRKVYVYYSNTSKPFSKLSKKEKLSKKLELRVPKLFVLSKDRNITDEQVRDLGNNDPDCSYNLDSLVPEKKRWKKCSKEYITYDPHPINVYDFKLLINLLGVRLLRFV